MRPPSAVTVFSADTAVDIEARKRAIEVQFATELEEESYELLDSALRQCARRALGASATGLIPLPGFCVMDDWWPNKTIAIEADRSVLNSTILFSLQALLEDEYSDWSIAIEVFEGFGSSAPKSLGPIQIYAGQILVIQQLAYITESEA